jgi:hypothetical protein
MKSIVIDIYSAHIRLFFSQKELQKWLKKNCNEETSDNLGEMSCYSEGMAGHFVTENEEFSYFLMLEKHDLTTLCHECGHLAYMILDAVGVRHDVNNHEAFCYLLHHIFEKAGKVYGLLP